MNKCEKVINSCKTVNQFEVAIKYSERYIKRQIRNICFASNFGATWPLPTEAIKALREKSKEFGIEYQNRVADLIFKLKPFDY